jgi:hypothetical protein
MWIRPHLARDWPTLSEPVLLADCPLESLEEPSVSASVTHPASTAGELTGVLVYFELELSPGVCLSTHPEHAGTECHWRNLVWVAPPGLQLRPGDRFKLTYRAVVPGARGGVSVSRS